MRRKRKDLISGTKARLAPSLTYLMGNEEIQREFGFENIPYTCIVDREGYIRYEKTGLSSDFKASMGDQLTWVIGLLRQNDGGLPRRRPPTEFKGGEKVHSDFAPGGLMRWVRSRALGIRERLLIPSAVQSEI